MATMTLEANLVDGSTPEAECEELRQWARQNWGAHRNGAEAEKRIEHGRWGLLNRGKDAEVVEGFTVDSAMDHLCLVTRFDDGTMGFGFSVAGLYVAFKLPELVPLALPVS